MEIFLTQSQRLAGRDADLFLNDVDAVHHLGDRMLDLDARVHLHEVGVGAADQKLQRPGIGVFAGAAGGDRGRV